MHVAVPNQPFLWTADSGFLVDTSSDLLGGKDWALVGGGGWVKGKGSDGRSSTLGEGLKKVVLQRKQDGREAFPGTTHNSID